MRTIHRAAGDESAIEVKHSLTDFTSMPDESMCAPAKEESLKATLTYM